MHGWTNTLRIDVGLKFICLQGNARLYEKLHRAEKVVNGISTALTAEENNEYISKAISETMNSLLSDAQLMKCLSSQ